MLARLINVCNQHTDKLVYTNIGKAHVQNMGFVCVHDPVVLHIPN